MAKIFTKAEAVKELRRHLKAEQDSYFNEGINFIPDRDDEWIKLVLWWEVEGIISAATADKWVSNPPRR